MKKVVDHVKNHWQGYAIALILLIVLFGAPTSHLSVSKLSSSYYGGTADYAVAESRIASPGYYYGSNDALEEEVRQYIRNANIGLESNSYDSSATSIRNAIVARNGIILSDNEGTNYNDLKYLNIRAKVDSKSLDTLLDELKQYGEVTSLNIYGNDVTGQYSDYSDRVERYESQMSKYLVMLDREDLTVEEEIQIQSRIDSLEDQLFYFRNRVGDIEEDVEYSDIYVSLSQEPSVLQEVNFLGFKDGFKMFLEALENAIEFILKALGFVLPFAIGYGVYRLVRKNKKSKKK